MLTALALAAGMTLGSMCAHEETGTASWYGPGFQGKLTANGETYDAEGLTAAHLTLPLATRVHVTNLMNGHSLWLRVNDRGPYARGRILDVTHKAARLLGFVQRGFAKVKVEAFCHLNPEHHTTRYI